MKRLLSALFAILVVSLGLVSCMSAEERLKVGIEEANKSYPETVIEGLVVKKVFDDGESVISVLEYDEDAYDFSDMDRSDFDGIFDGLDFLEVADLFVENGRGFVIRSVGKQSGVSFDFAYTASEFAALVASRK